MYVGVHNELKAQQLQGAVERQARRRAADRRLFANSAAQSILGTMVPQGARYYVYSRHRPHAAIARMAHL